MRLTGQRAGAARQRQGPALLPSFPVCLWGQGEVGASFSPEAFLWKGETLPGSSPYFLFSLPNKSHVQKSA